MLLVFQAVQTAAGGINVGAVIVATFGLDVFRQMLQVSLTTSVFRCVYHPEYAGFSCELTLM